MIVPRLPGLPMRCRATNTESGPGLRSARARCLDRTTATSPAWPSLLDSRWNSSWLTRATRTPRASCSATIAAAAESGRRSGSATSASISQPAVTARQTGWIPSTTNAPCSRRCLRLASSLIRLTSGLAAELIVSAIAPHPAVRPVRPASPLEVAGGRDRGGRALPDRRCRDAGALEVVHVDVGGLGSAGRRVERGYVLRPLLVVGQQGVELSPQVR